MMTSTATAPLAVLIADDHPLIREALKNVLRELAERVVTLEAPDCAVALSRADEHPDLDLALVDLDLPGIGGLALLSALRERHPALPLVVLSAHDERRNVMESLERGAMGFIPKSSSNAVMLSALRLVLSGGRYLPPQVLGGGGSSSAVRSAADLGLTQRQRQVLALLMQGNSNKAICRHLGVAERTVKVHVSAVLKALEVTTRTQAVIAARRLGLDLASLSDPDGAR